MTRSLMPLVAALLAFPVHAAPQCAATSAAELTPLVELFTSEGCSSCPPADRWLAGLRSSAVAQGRLNALAYHVDYWDYIGWKDRFAQPGFGERHRDLVTASGGEVRYTPQVFVNGFEFRSWHYADPPTPGEPARLSIRASNRALGDRRWEFVIQTRSNERRAVSVSLALAENDLKSDVQSGENRGEHLRHDFVVRAVVDWTSPQADSVRTQLIDLPAPSNPDRTRATIAVRDASGRLMQSLSLPLCDG